MTSLGDSWSGDTAQDGGVNLFQREGGKRAGNLLPQVSGFRAGTE